MKSITGIQQATTCTASASPTRVRGKSESFKCKISGVPTNMLYVKSLMTTSEVLPELCCSELETNLV
jgi:hypothetical protein